MVPDTLPVRVLILATNREGGGAQMIAHDLADDLADRGHCVRLRYLYEADRQAQAPGGQSLVLVGPRARYTHYAAMPWRIRDEIADFRPDAVIAHMPLACVLGQPIAAAMGVRARVAVQHAPPGECKTAMRLLDRLCGTTGIYTTNVAVSKSMLNAFAGCNRLYRSKQTVVANGIGLDAPSGPREVIRHRFGLPLDEPVIISCGRLTEQKNQSFLIEVVRRLPAHLALLGCGELERPLRSLARALGCENRVHFLGHLDRATTWEVMAASDVFALPSHYEGMSLALIEALHIGLPIVASDIDANRDVLVDENGAEHGILVPITDPVPWVKLLARVLDDPSFSGQLGDMARHRAQAFTLSAMTRGYEALIMQELGLETHTIERMA